jgi:hypothetical protein
MTADSASVIRPFRLEPEAPAPDLPAYIPAGSYRPEMTVDPTFALELTLFLAKQLSPQWQRQRPANIFGLQGPPGEGKTEQAKQLASQQGMDVTLLPVARIGGETENAGTLFLDQLLTGCAAVSRSTRKPHVVIIDDADQGIFCTRDNRNYQVDSDGTNAFLQYVADNRDAYVDCNGMPIPIVMTGNDFTGLRESLVSRITFYTYAPTWRERATRFEQIVGPRGWRERRALKAFCRAYKHQPLRFLVQCHATAFDRRVRATLPRNGPLDPDQIDEAVIAAHGNLDIAGLYRAAKRLTREQPRSFIKTWR